jgi:hypothetical protein
MGYYKCEVNSEEFAGNVTFPSPVHTMRFRTKLAAGTTTTAGVAIEARREFSLKLAIASL